MVGGRGVVREVSGGGGGVGRGGCRQDIASLSFTMRSDSESCVCCDIILAKHSGSGEIGDCLCEEGPAR